MKVPDKFTLNFERRDDGGLRVYSNEIPGFMLSSQNINGVLEDLGPVLKVFLEWKDDENKDVASSR